LSETFKDSESDQFNNYFKDKIEEQMREFFKNQSKKTKKIGKDKHINNSNLNKFLKTIKPTLSSGEDMISNVMLKNVSTKFKKVILHLFQLSIEESRIPDRWKNVIVKMIPKKNIGKSDPKNYRPIYMTNCLARLCERFVLLVIHNHLKKKKILVKQQSGFRAHRQTKDNIFTLCQANLQAMNKKNKNCVVFFDISKAFDKVWHYGLLYKLKELKFDYYVINWIKEFLNERHFCVKINNIVSCKYRIETGVPQGGVLSPILFSIFINDVIENNTSYRKTKIEACLFADDLSTYCSSKKLDIIEKSFAKYMKKLVSFVET
jgi:retron-type reverse transcriptase